MVEPSLLKCSSLAMAEILGEGVLLTKFCLLMKEHEEMEDDDDNFWNFMSVTRLLGAANEPADDIAANVDAIYSFFNYLPTFHKSSFYSLPI